MRKLHVLFGLVIAGLFSRSVYAVPVPFQPTWNSQVPNAVILTYDPTDGHVAINGNGLLLTTLELRSASGRFIPSGIPAGTISPPFDVATPTKIFKLSIGGFASLDLGRAYSAGVSCNQIFADLLVDGSILPAGNLQVGGGPYMYGCPEPSSLALIGCGLLGMLKMRCKSRLPRNRTPQL